MNVAINEISKSIFIVMYNCNVFLLYLYIFFIKKINFINVFLYIIGLPSTTSCVEIINFFFIKKIKIIVNSYLACKVASNIDHDRNTI